MKIEPRKAPDPKMLTEKQEKEKEWAKDNLKLSPPSPSKEAGAISIDTNFFKVTIDKLNGNDLDIRKYRIELGKVNNKVPPKREVRRALIEQLL